MPSRPVTIRPARPDDAAGVADVYNHYVLNTVATFEEEPVAVSAMATRIADTLAAPLPWLVAEDGAAVVGYAYAARWKPRAAYRHTVETTVYLAPGRSGQGLGTRLYAALLEAVWAAGMHTAIGGIALPNAASVALHEKLGFRPVGTFRETGFKHMRRVDVGYWQVLRPGGQR